MCSSAHAILKPHYHLMCPSKLKEQRKKIQKIAFSYRIKNRKENDWYYFPPLSDLDSLTAFSKEETWTRIDDDSHFAFHVGELHPNVPYEFKFTLLVSITLEKNPIRRLKNGVADNVAHYPR